MPADVLLPTSPDEAVALFGEGDGITVVAGGTILLPEIAAGRVKPARALMLQRRRHAHSYAIANVAVCQADGGLRIGVAGIGGTAVRCRSVEQSRNPDDVLNDVEPVDDAVASAAYRRRVLPLLVRQALDQLENA